MHGQYSPAVLARFWARVDRSGDCWLWTGYKTPNGYGQMMVEGRGISAHRLAWELEHGPIPPGMVICHDCPGGDNRACVRHLFLGSQRDNMLDMHAKGRGQTGDAHYSRREPERLARGDRHYARVRPERLARGEAHGLAVITADVVREMRRLYAAGGITQTQLAERFGTDQTNVSLIVRRKAWAHVP